MEVDSCDETVISMEAATIAFKLMKVLSQPILHASNKYQITTSVGISSYVDGQTSIGELLKQANTAMYHAKQAGRNRYSFFKLEMQQRVEDRLRVEKQLRRAIKNGELQLIYQPQVDLRGQCRSAEAFARWHHQERGIIYPAEFIYIAKESNDIDKLGEFVFSEACRQFARWRASGLVLDYISVNVSSRQVHHGSIVNQITRGVAANEISPSNLMIEITEGVILNHKTKTVEKLRELKAPGVRISIDDFGSGFSS